MPLYEYICRRCNQRFELLRSIGRMDELATCPLGHDAGERVLSVFAAMTKDASGGASPIAGAGGCAGCAGGSCAGCSLN